MTILEKLGKAKGKIQNWNPALVLAQSTRGRKPRKKGPGAGQARYGRRAKRFGPPCFQLPFPGPQLST